MPAKPTFSAGAAALAVVARASAPPHREWGPGTRPSGPRSDLGHWEAAEPTSLAEEEAGAKSSSVAAKWHRPPEGRRATSWGRSRRPRVSERPSSKLLTSSVEVRRGVSPCLIQPDLPLRRNGLGNDKTSHRSWAEERRLLRCSASLGPALLAGRMYRGKRSRVPAPPSATPLVVVRGALVECHPMLGRRWRGGRRKGRERRAVRSRRLPPISPRLESPVGCLGAGQGFLGGQNDPRQYASAAGGLAGAGLGTAALAGALAPAMASGIGAFIAPAVGALQTSVFRGPDEPHAAREAKEVREAGEVGGGLGTQLSFAMSPSEMYQMLTDAGSGATSYSRKNPILIDVGGQRMADLGEAGFFSAISQNPNALNVSLQAGVNPGYLTDINEGIRRAILRQTALLGAREQYPSLGTALEGRLGEERHRAGAARLAHIEKFRGGHMLDEYGNIQYGAPTRAERPWDMPALAAPSGLPPVLAALFGELGPIAWEGQQAAPGPAGPVFNPWEYPMSSYNLGGP